MLRGFLTTVGLGAGLMYLFDPQLGRRRRALLKDRIQTLPHDVARMTWGSSRDRKNRVQERENWSPSTEFVVGAGGAALFLYGLIRGAPTSSLVGAVGLGMCIRQSIEKCSLERNLGSHAASPGIEHGATMQGQSTMQEQEHCATAPSSNIVVP
jgi:hypothetical protein